MWAVGVGDVGRLLFAQWERCISLVYAQHIVVRFNSSNCATTTQRH